MNCLLCSQTATQGFSLANGRILHSKCFQRLTSDYSNSEHQASAARAEFARVRSELISQSGFLQKAVSFLGGGMNREQLRVHLNVCEEKMKVAERAFSLIQAQATPIFDVFLDYPPDWKSRRERVWARDGSCVACGSSWNLQVHHVTPLSRGGSNRIENLRLLCETCHKVEHGGKEFSSVHSTKPLAFAERIQVIESAISAGRDVEFLYRKPTDSAKRSRRVTPHELVEMDHKHDEGITLCLQGYCHSRKAIRVFALKRMTGIRRI
jgi:hypothetical protein